MQAMKELHLAEIGLISGGITKKQVITGIAIGVGAVAVGAACFAIGHNSQLASQVVSQAASVASQTVGRLADQEGVDQMLNDIIRLNTLLEQMDKEVAAGVLAGMVK